MENSAKTTQKRFDAKYLVRLTGCKVVSLYCTKIMQFWNNYKPITNSQTVSSIARCDTVKAC